jgi:hypothetical protein
MLMNNPLVQSPGWWSLPKKKRFEMASSQSMINPFPRERKILPMPYSYSHGSVDPGLNAANARVASGTTIPQTSTAGKKGLSMKNMIKALTDMKKPPDQAKAGAWKGGEARPQLPAPPQFAALGGVNPSIMNTGGLPDARNKKWWEIMGYS